MSSDFLAQFKVYTIWPIPLPYGLNIDFTNLSLFAVIATVTAILILWLSTVPKELVPGRIQCFGESIFDFISSLLVKSTGDDGVMFLPFVLTMFMFVLLCNLIGLVPGAFTVTSHVAATFCLSATVIVVLTLYGFKRRGMDFLSVFLPHGVPALLAPLIVIIEVVTYCFRSISLTLRLSSNMVAGHIMIKVIAILGSSLSMSALFVWPILFLSAIIAFESFVAVLQSYIFVVLSCVYLSDAFKKH